MDYRKLMSLSDDALLRRTERLANAERAVSAHLVACLAEVERRPLLADRAYVSLFDYCVRKLKLSEGSAARRVAAAHASRKRPEVLSYLASGALSLSVICRIEPYLSEPDSLSIMEEAVGLGRAKLDELVSRLAERKRARCASAVQAPEEEQGRLDLIPGARSSAPEPSPVPAPDRLVAPVPGRVRISFEASSALKEKLERTGTLLAHRLRTRRMEELIETLADIALRGLDPSRRAGRPRPVKGNPRRVPWSVRKQVWERDGGRCSYEAEDGTRCGSTSRLQYDHIQPWALGGRSGDAANIRLLCRAHNLRLGRRAFPEATARALARREGADG